MQVFNCFQDLPEKAYTGCVIALGTFDGIHLGHIDIIEIAKKEATKKGTKSIVFSFSNHPLEEIAPDKVPLRICSEEKKKDLLEKLGIDVLFNMHFDQEFALVSSTQFILALKKYFNPSCIVVGDNYSYGYLGAGTANTLITDGKKYDFTVIIRNLITVDNAVVSSTNIRNCILQDDLKTANELLGRYYALTGNVIHGDARGRTLGFPTANLRIFPNNLLIPVNGVYMAFVKVLGKVYKAVVNIGTNPTFFVKEKRIEAHILNFEQDIYEQDIEIAFVKKIRDEKTFSNVKELIVNIQSDKNQTDNYLDLDKRKLF